MNSFPAMEWNTKWDWENIVMLNSKEGESAKKFQPTDWGIEEVVDIDAGSFNLSGGVGGSGGSGSDLGHVSSARSSISVSTDSLSKEGLKTSKFTFEAFESFCGDFGKKEELPKDEIKGSSPQLSSLVGSGEPLIGLKLGKRTYFENNCASNNATASSPAAISASSTVTTKKLKASCLNGPVPRCQVEGCNLDLSSTKEYYWKHRVCENHSKSPKVVIGGVERRFCQQCSRFHGLLEFDEKKRSCRKRLSDHNARRRKPQQETIPFNSTRLSSSIYDVQQQLNFVLNDFPVVQSRPPATNSVWESCASDSKFTLTRDYHVKPEENIIVDRQPHLPAIQLPRHYSNRVLPSKTASAEVLNQDMKEPVFPGGAAPDYCRALSLLSTTTNCWGSCEELESPTLHHHHPHHPMHENGNTTTLPFHAVSQGLLLPPASPEYWQHTNQHSTIPPQSHQLHHHAAAAANPNTITGFKEFQIFKDSHFYSKN